MFGDREAQFADLSAAARIGPSAAVYNERAEYYRTEKRWDDAIDDYLAAIPLYQADEPHYRLVIGKCHAEAGRVEEAILSYTEGIRCDLKGLWAKDLLEARAAAYRRAGRKREAEADEKTSSEIGGYHPGVDSVDPSAPESTLGVRRVTGLLPDGEALDRWCQARRWAGERRPKLVVVATSGGGIAAAKWTALCLTEIERRSPGFPYHVRIVTGASGGMVGAAYYVATLG
jgi:tetratricopeptide (TPR) repeat protein